MYGSHYYVIATMCVEVNFIITSPLAFQEVNFLVNKMLGYDSRKCMIAWYKSMVLGSASYFESVKSFTSFLM